MTRTEYHVRTHSLAFLILMAQELIREWVKR